MTTTTTGRLAEDLERRRTADEALDTIVAALAMLNGEIVTPAVLGHQQIRRDLRSALLTLHIALGPGLSQAAPNLRAAIGRANLLDEVLEGPDTLPALDKSIQTVRDLIAMKDRRIGEIEAEIGALDGKRLDDPVDADFEAMEKRPAGGGSGVILYMIVAVVAVLAGYAVGVLSGS